MWICGEWHSVFVVDFIGNFVMCHMLWLPQEANTYYKLFRLITVCHTFWVLFSVLDGLYCALFLVKRNTFFFLNHIYVSNMCLLKCLLLACFHVLKERVCRRSSHSVYTVPFNFMKLSITGYPKLIILNFIKFSNKEMLYEVEAVQVPLVES